MEMLHTEAEKLHIDIIGIQESRSRMEGHKEGKFYHVLSTPATPAGHGGVQIWIAKRWGKEEQIEITQNNMKIISHEAAARKWWKDLARCLAPYKT